MTFDLDPLLQGQILKFTYLLIFFKTNADRIMILNSTCRFMDIADDHIEIDRPSHILFQSAIFIKLHVEL